MKYQVVLSIYMCNADDIVSHILIPSSNMDGSQLFLHIDPTYLYTLYTCAFTRQIWNPVLVQIK
ncbi:MAG: hypothetical protein ACI90V_001632 [Bacillariaceae sp.]|jgi:hypothetical protein